VSGTAIGLAERGLLPLATLRLGVRALLRTVFREASAAHDLDAFVRMLEDSPVAVETDAANEQHYEVPAAFYQLALGRNLKYSGAYWPTGVDDLAGAETAMLELTCERAELADGQDILELGADGARSRCTWPGPFRTPVSPRCPTPPRSGATSRPTRRTTCAS
jgi:cyclopropane-fatty-acyl-phospholipid synthase